MLTTTLLPMPTPDYPRSYELRWVGGSPNADIPKVSTFESESALVERVIAINEQIASERRSTSKRRPSSPGLAFGDAKVWVYYGKAPDPELGNHALTVGKIDAAVVLSDEEVNEDKLDDPL